MIGVWLVERLSLMRGTLLITEDGDEIAVEEIIDALAALTRERDEARAVIPVGARDMARFFAETLPPGGRNAALVSILNRMADYSDGLSTADGDKESEGQ